MLTNIALVLVFVLVGGVFAGAEIALVSLREGQVRPARASAAGAAQKVAAARRDPNRFLAAVQIGVTLAGFLSAAFGAAAFADDLAPVLERLGRCRTARRRPRRAGRCITLVITTCPLVLSELAPKRLALQRAERLSLCSLAPTLDRVATLSRPVIWLLSRSTDVVVRLLGGDPRRTREPSPRRSCATSSRPTRRSAGRSASSSRTSSRPASGRCTR